MAGDDDDERTWGIALLRTLGASTWLVRHHQLVVEAAELICDALARELGLPMDRPLILLGASLHDAGKIVHPEEMSNNGHAHEAAGVKLLVAAGVKPSAARFCITHAAWDGSDCVLEDQLVALADKLWKGKRDEALERHLVSHIAKLTTRAPWDVFTRFDAICDAVAAGGADRLSRSVV